MNLELRAKTPIAEESERSEPLGLVKIGERVAGDAKGSRRNTHKIESLKYEVRSLKYEV